SAADATDIAAANASTDRVLANIMFPPIGKRLWRHGLLRRLDSANWSHLQLSGDPRQRGRAAQAAKRI
ncbi:MAG: hypothetical protein Q8K88_02520, partial [Bradyrhizobium sp.]|nr:hypothetical protein [Bradyrhizobium sp.]